MKTFSAYWTDDLGEAIKEAALEQVPNGYRISTMDSDEYEAIANAINQGIDSHLEAVSATEIQKTQYIGEYCVGQRAYITIHPEDLHTFVRRLMESGSEVAEDLAFSICYTLEIELV